MPFPDLEDQLDIGVESRIYTEPARHLIWELFRMLFKIADIWHPDHSM